MYDFEKKLMKIIDDIVQTSNFIQFIVISKSSEAWHFQRENFKLRHKNYWF